MELDTGWAVRSASVADTPLDLADNFYFLAHDHVSGVPRLHARAVELGLAGCLLAELLLSGWATVDDGLLSAVDCRPAAPVDVGASRGRPEQAGLVRGVWDQVVREPWRHPLRTWLTVVGQDASRQVAGRLADGGHLRVGRSRRFRGGRGEPTNWNTAGWPAARLRGWLEHRQPFPVRDVVLLALAEATGLRTVVSADLDQRARDYHEWLLNNLAHQLPHIAELAGHTAAAVGAAVLVRGTK